MTIKREYVCNFCRNTLNGNAKMFGVLWGPNNKELRAVAERDSENHLCACCVNAIKEMKVSWND